MDEPIEGFSSLRLPCFTHKELLWCPTSGHHAHQVQRPHDRLWQRKPRGVTGNQHIAPEASVSLLAKRCSSSWSPCFGVLRWDVWVKHSMGSNTKFSAGCWRLKLTMYTTPRFPSTQRKQPKNTSTKHHVTCSIKKKLGYHIYQPIDSTMNCFIDRFPRVSFHVFLPTLGQRKPPLFHFQNRRPSSRACRPHSPALSNWGFPSWGTSPWARSWKNIYRKNSALPDTHNR